MFLGESVFDLLLLGVVVGVLYEVYDLLPVSLAAHLRGVLRGHYCTQGVGQLREGRVRIQRVSVLVRPEKTTQLVVVHWRAAIVSQFLW